MILYKKIGQICSVLNGFAFKSENYVDSGLRIIRIVNVQKGVIEDSQPVYYPLNTPNMDKYLLYEGDLLLSLTGNVGRVAILEREFLPAALNQRVACLRIIDSVVTTKYLFHILNSAKFEKDCIQASNGVAQKNMSTEWLKQYEIPVYPVDMQERIVEVLDKIQSAIQKRRKQICDLESLVKSQFIEMFGSPQTNEKGYPLLTVDDVIEFQGGSQPDKSYFEYKKTDNNVRLIQIRDYKTDKFVTYIPKNMAKRYCYADDIMIGRYGPPIFQILQGIEGSYNVALMKAIPKKGNKEFIRQFLKQDCLLHYLEGLSKRTAGQDGIQMDKLKQFPFPYPPIELQEQFASFIEQTDKSKVLLAIKLFFHLYTAICLKAFEKSTQMMYNHI